MTTIINDQKLKFKVNDFSETVEQSFFTFREAFLRYLNGDLAGFREKMQQIYTLEHRADNIRLELEKETVTNFTVSGWSSDTLLLFDKLDDIVDLFKKILLQIDIEKPVFTGVVSDMLVKMLEITCGTINSLLKAINGYCNNRINIKDLLLSVNKSEKKSDKFSLEIQYVIFNDTNLPFSRKMHIKGFVDSIDMVSDISKNIADILYLMLIRMC